MNIKIINLAVRVDRKEKLIGELTRHNIKGYEFMEAVDGRSLDRVDMIVKGMILEGKEMTRGEYGCYLSHYNLYKEILKGEEELILVLEDDIYFINNFNYKLNKILKKVKEVEWDMFYIGINCWEEKCLEGEYIDKEIYYPINPIWGTHGYLIKRESVKKIVNRMLPMEVPVDVFLMTRLPDIKRLVLLNTLVKTYNVDSDTRLIK